MWWCFGWPYDTSVAMARLVFCGLFDRYPNLKIVTHHMGGMIPITTAASARACRCSARAPRTRTTRGILPSLKRPHLDYFQEFTPTPHVRGRHRAFRCGLDSSVARVVFDTGRRLGPIKPAIDVLRRLDVSDADKRKIFGGNAEKLLKK